MRTGKRPTWRATAPGSRRWLDPGSSILGYRAGDFRLRGLPFVVRR